MVRVLIVDDQAMVRSGFRMILELEDDIDVVGEADDGDAALELAGTVRPDVVLMDLRMPRMDGIAATRAILARGGPAPRVLVVTTFDDDALLYEALRAGAAGFLLKNSPAEELVDALRAVAAGDGLLAPAVTRRVIEEFARSRPATRATVPESFAQLTERELDVLRHIAAGRSNGEIADVLGISPATARTHVGRILAKLGLRDRVQAVVLAYETGFVTPGT